MPSVMMRNKKKQENESNFYKMARNKKKTRALAAMFLCGILLSSRVLAAARPDMPAPITRTSVVMLISGIQTTAHADAVRLDKNSIA